MTNPSAQNTAGISPWDVLDAGLTAWEDFSHADKERIVRHFAPKVKYLATRLKVRLPKNVELNELISSGTLGLMEALRKFKPQLGIKFDTYAESRIKGAMLDDLRRLDWFPRSLRQRVRQISEGTQTLEHALGRSPTESELAAHLDMPEKDVREGLEALQNQLCLSLDTLEENFGQAEERPEGEPFAGTAAQELLEKVAGLIEQLTDREKLVLSLYYTDELNMRETAEVMGITEGRVSQLRTQALERLRKNFAARYGDAGEI